MGTFIEGMNELSVDGAGTGRIGSQYIAEAAPSLYTYMVYPGGVFRKNDIETWLSSSHYAPQALANWIAHPDYDLYWISRDFEDRWPRVHWPIMHVGGWYDMLSQGTLDAFVGFKEHGADEARGKQKLIIGPWAHVLFTAKVGESTFPDGAAPKDDITIPGSGSTTRCRAR